MKFLKVIVFAALSSLLFSCAHGKSDKSDKSEPVPAPAVTKAIPVVTVNFGFDKTKLDKTQKEVVKKGIEGLDKKLAVAVIGYTDSQGSKKYNAKLSKKRAEVVVKYLKELGWEGKFVVEGKGEEKLLNADKTVAEHKANRRADIVFLLN